MAPVAGCVPQAAEQGGRGQGGVGIPLRRGRHQHILHALSNAGSAVW